MLLQLVPKLPEREHCNTRRTVTATGPTLSFRMARRGSGRATSAILESGLAESWRRFAAFPPKVPSSTAKWSCWARIGKPSFQGLQYFDPKDSGRLCFYAFDLLHLNGADLMAQPLEERRAALADLVADVHPQI